MDGTGRNGVKGTTLIDRALKARAEKPFSILKYIAVAAIIIPLLMLLAGWHWLSCITLAVTALVFFGYRYYAKWHKKRVIRKAKKTKK
jgi:membrane protein implicated in regulation of membrane protease activity